MSWWLSGLFLKLAGEAGELYNPNNQFQTAEPNQAGWRVTLKLSVKLGDDPPVPRSVWGPALPLLGGGAAWAGWIHRRFAPSVPGAWSGAGPGGAGPGIWPHRRARDVQTRGLYVLVNVRCVSRRV